MGLLLIGINHRTAGVKVREKFSFTRKHLEESLRKLKESRLALGAIIVSTCNRTEVYSDIEDESCDIPRIEDFIFTLYNAEDSERERYFYILKDTDVIRHLFRVAAGLNSQVLGETQILSQVRSAWTIAQEMGVSSERLDEIFVMAQKMGKHIRQETKISQGNISIASVAIKMLEEKIGRLEERSVLIIGAGKIATLMSNYLREKKIKGIFVASRTYPRAQELASYCGGRAVDFSRLQEELKEIDIVISSSSSPHIILNKETLIKVMRLRRAPLVIMDLAVPRDVDPLVRDIKGISLYDLDDLQCVVEDNYKNREREAVIAERIIEQELGRFLKEVSINV